jgi:hypothetical protein
MEPLRALTLSLESNRCSLPCSFFFLLQFFFFHKVILQVADLLQIPKQWVNVMKTLAQHVFSLTLGSPNAALLAVAASVTYFGQRYLMRGETEYIIDALGEGEVLPGVPGIFRYARNTPDFYPAVKAMLSSPAPPSGSFSSALLAVSSAFAPTPSAPLPLLPIPGANTRAAKRARAEPAGSAKPGAPSGPQSPSVVLGAPDETGSKGNGKYWWSNLADAGGNDAGFWRAIAESLADSEQQELNNAIEMSLNEEYMRAHDLEPVPAQADGVCACSVWML